MPNPPRRARIINTLKEEKPPIKPVMIYDGDCGFCRRWINRWQYATGERIEYLPAHEAKERYPSISSDDLVRSVHLVEPLGEVSTGAHAVFRTLALGSRKRWPLWVYRHVPGIRFSCETTYSFVANHRRAFSFLTGLLWGRDHGPPSHILVRWTFVRLLAVVYFIAFASLGVQVLGLIGSNGILPAQAYLDTLFDRLGDGAYWRAPTIAWFSCSDASLQALCWTGVMVSVLVFLRIAPGLLLLVLWILYFSLYQVGQTFLSFQWDILLLEVGFVGILWASWKPWPRLSTDSAPSRLVRWLIILLLFRLMFSSGIVKLLDDDPNHPTWHQLTALTFHYETQCLPNPLAWYVHQLPVWFHKFSTLAMFGIEIGLPFLFFLPRRLRLIAFFGQCFFQVLIVLTGNYNFFNFLTIVLCVPLLDDAALRCVLPSRWVHAAKPRRNRRKTPWGKRLIIWPCAAVILMVSTVWMTHTLRSDRSNRRLAYDYFPKPMQEVVRTVLPLHLANSYGLFRSMTTRRPEIIVEGSQDGRIWLPYEFSWKPGDPGHRPRQVAPHQPRLDWQMWFAALGNYRSPRNRWFLQFERRLLEGSSDVLDLLESNPFPDEAPRYIRAVLYDYRFTDQQTKRDTGAWWTRKRIKAYTPVLSLESFRRR